MQTKDALTLAAVVIFAFAAGLGAAHQNPPTPSPAAPQQGRGGGQGRQGGGRGPNFPQQQRPPGDPAVTARGQALYGVNCTSCHGVDLRGGDQGGPNLLRSETVLTDQKGEKILAVVRNGSEGPGGVMPALQLPDADILAIAEYIHSVTSRLGGQGRPPESATALELNVLVGNASDGRAYFAQACSRCHSLSADLQGIASRVADPRALQNLWVSGGGGGRGRGGGEVSERNITVVVTAPGSPAVSGRLVRIDDFVVTLVQENGVRRTFVREGGVPKVEIRDPLESHRRLALELTDRDMHNLTAYLATLK